MSDKSRKPGRLNKTESRKSFSSKKEQDESVARLSSNISKKGTSKKIKRPFFPYVPCAGQRGSEFRERLWKATHFEAQPDDSKPKRYVSTSFNLREHPYLKEFYKSQPLPVHYTSAVDAAAWEASINRPPREQITLGIRFEHKFQSTSTSRSSSANSSSNSEEGRISKEIETEDRAPRSPSLSPRSQSLSPRSPRSPSPDLPVHLTKNHLNVTTTKFERIEAKLRNVHELFQSVDSDSLTGILYDLDDADDTEDNPDDDIETCDTCNDDLDLLECSYKENRRMSEARWIRLKRSGSSISESVSELLSQLAMEHISRKESGNRLETKNGRFNFFSRSKESHTPTPDDPTPENPVHPSKQHLNVTMTKFERIKAELRNLKKFGQRIDIEDNPDEDIRSCDSCEDDLDLLECSFIENRRVSEARFIRLTIESEAKSELFSEAIEHISRKESGKSFENQKGRFEYFINPKDKTKRKSTPSYKTKKKSTPSSSATPTGSGHSVSSSLTNLGEYDIKFEPETQPQAKGKFDGKPEIRSALRNRDSISKRVSPVSLSLPNLGEHIELKPEPQQEAKLRAVELEMELGIGNWEQSGSDYEDREDHIHEDHTDEKFDGRSALRNQDSISKRGSQKLQINNEAQVCSGPYGAIRKEVIVIDKNENRKETEDDLRFQFGGDSMWHPSASRP